MGKPVFEINDTALNDIKAALLIGLGYSREAAADAIGVNRKTVWDHLKKTYWMAPLAEWVKAIDRDRRATIKEEAAEDSMKRLKKLFGPAVDVYAKNVLSDDPAVAQAAADRITDRVLGKAANRNLNVNLTDGTVNHEHQIVLSGDVLNVVKMLNGDDASETARLFNKRPLLVQGNEPPAIDV